MYKEIAILILTLVVGPVLGYYVHKWTTEVNTNATQQNAPIEVLVKLVQEQMETAKETNKASGQERAKFVEVVTELSANIRALNENQTQMRQENRERTASMHTRFEEIKDKVEDLKTEVVRGQNG